MAFSIIGRKIERALLQQISTRADPDFLAVYGRRRVGKTFLIRNFFKNLTCIYFEITGLKNGTTSAQIGLFFDKLRETFSIDIPPRPKLPKNWLDAFQMLTAVRYGLCQMRSL